MSQLCRQLGPEEMEEAKVHCGSVEKFEKELMRGDTSLRMSKGGKCAHEVWMVVWTDDFDDVGTSTPMMKDIMDACNDEWAAKEVTKESEGLHGRREADL